MTTAITIIGASPFTDPTSWDTLVVAGQPWHGKIEIRGAERSYKWDIKDGIGLQGAIETYRGQTPPPFEITFYIWTPDLYLRWQIFQLLFMYNGAIPFQGVKPVDIFHPSLANLNIFQVICEGVGAVEKQSDDLMFAATVKLREYFPPLPINTTQTPDAAADKPEGTADDPVIARLQKELGQLHQTAINAGVF